MSIQHKIDEAREEGIKKTRLEYVKKSIKMLRLDGNSEADVLSKLMTFYSDDFSKEELSHIIAETK